TRWPRDWSSDVCSSDLSQFFFFAAVATSAIFAALTVLPTRVAAPSDYLPVYYYGLIERAVVTSLAVFLVLLLLLVAWFAVPLSRSEERRVGKECWCRWC